MTSACWSFELEGIVQGSTVLSRVLQTALQPIKLSRSGVQVLMGDMQTIS